LGFQTTTPTIQDREDLEFIVTSLDVDWVALSFVQE
jgi:pyruvate kinase